MKKILRLLTIGLLSATILTGCCISHEWQDATCAVPQTCSKCGKTKGTPTNNHIWEEATCIAPQTCTVCGKTEGAPNDNHAWQYPTCTKPKTCRLCGETVGNVRHDWKKATCTAPMTCKKCGETKGTALEHDWKEATCTAPKTCSLCGETEGTFNHDWKDATCTEPKTCSLCGETEGDPIDHVPGDWETIQKATLSNPGTKVRKCVNCSEEIDTKRTYKEIKYKDDHFNFTGKEFGDYLQTCINTKYEINTSHAVSIGEMTGYGIYKNSELLCAYCFEENTDGFVKTLATLGQGSDSEENVIIFGYFISKAIDNTITSDDYLDGILYNSEFHHNGLTALYADSSIVGGYPCMFIHY